MRGGRCSPAVMLGTHGRGARNGDAVNAAHRYSIADIGRLRLLSWCHRIAFPHAIKLPGRLQIASSQRPHAGTAQHIVSAIGQCRSCSFQSALPTPQARVMGEMAGLPGMLQHSVLGVLTALLQLCISCPRLVPQLEVLAELLPHGVLAARLTGSGRTDPASRSDGLADLGPDERFPCSGLMWLLAAESRGLRAAVGGFVGELLHAFSFLTGYMLNPGGRLPDPCKTSLKRPRPALVVGARCPFSHPTCYCALLQAAECAVRPNNTSFSCAGFIEYLELDRLYVCRQLQWLDA